MTRTHPNPAAGHASTTETPEPVADVSGIALNEHAVVRLGPDWPAVHALARYYGVVVAGAVVGQRLGGPEGVVAGAMTAITTYVVTATVITATRTRIGRTRTGRTRTGRTRTANRSRR